MSKSSYNTIQECTNKCTSERHGDILTAAITKREIHDEHLCAYLSYSCCRCESVKDSQGRTTLHMAASCGRNTLVRWLVENRYANINGRDAESGYTPLHRSIFYGKLDSAIELIKLGANLGIQDSEGLNFLEHSMIDGLKPPTDCVGGEIYSWGTNSNNSLGPQQSRTMPELLDVFHKKYPQESVQQVCLSRFHSIILTISGKCYSCGHGQGGRLGLGIEHTEVTPKQIRFPKFQATDSVIIQCSISRDHSLFLSSDGCIYSCGLNTHKVLGIPQSAAQSLAPWQIKNLPIKLFGICANVYHSLAWGPAGLYTWGLNAGQLGHQLHNKIEDKYIVYPKLVKSFNYNDNKLKLVCSSNGAIAVYTDKGDLYVLHEYQCKKIASKQLNLVQISAVGGKLNLSLDPELIAKQNKDLKVAALTNTGNLLIWQESDPSLLRCIFSINRALILKQMTLNDKEVLFITNNGEGFTGSVKPRRKKVATEEESADKSAFHKFLERDLCVYVRLQKFPRIHRALNIQSDPKGENICVIQAPPYRPQNFPETAESEMTGDFLNLLEDNVTFDGIQDVSFKINGKAFSGHRFVIASASPYLEKLMSNYDRNTSITLDGVHPDIFNQLLCFIYTKRSDLTAYGALLNVKLQSIGTKSQYGVTSEIGMEAKKSKSNKENSIQNPVRMLHELSKRMEVTDLQKILNNLEIQNNVIKPKTDVTVKVPVLKFNRLSFPELYDVKITCKDKKVIKAHKCILAARMEYFNSMFSMRWSGDELSEVSLPFFEPVVMSLLEYLYTDSLSALENKEIDHLFKVLVLADQFLVHRLKEECEIHLTDLVTLKNCSQMYSLAHAYNAVNLKYWCSRFILSNLTAILELRVLEDLETELVQQLSKVYFEESPHLWCRVITPYSTAVSDEEIIEVSSLHPIDFEEKAVKIKKTATKKRIRSYKTSFSEKYSDLPADGSSIVLETSVEDEVSDSPDVKLRLSDSSRLNSILKASEKISKEDVETEFSTLSTKFDQLNFSSSFSDSHQFPLLNSPTSNSGVHRNTPKNDKHRVVRMSQKQRKRLSSHNSTHEEVIGSPETPEFKKNPWKIDPVSSPDDKSTINNNFNMENIILSEKREKENLNKIKSKKLMFTQIEDKAIEELRVFYNADNAVDEVILVERVNIGAIATPVWVPKTK